LKTIVLFGAGKSATVLIDYLLAESAANKWKFIIADVNRDQILSKTNNAAFAEAVELDINDETERGKLIEKAHVVISMMPPALHFLIAKDCVEYRKHLLTASYLDAKMKSLQDEINNRKLLFLCEMGLDPGIDHMSAMKLIDEIKTQGGVITSFKSHCGGLVAPESDNNPWHYKISWNPRNVVLAGKAGAVYKEDNLVINKPYETLFNQCAEVDIAGLGKLAAYPNRDSLSYIPVYKLGKANTFIRTTLRHPAYCKGWDAIVKAGLCDENAVLITDGLTFKKWSESITPLITKSNRSLLDFLGLFEDILVPEASKSSADILQYLLETKLVMESVDKDMIVMQHEIEYELDGVNHSIVSSLIVKGEDNLRTAMAKTVGLPLGIAAKLILDGDLKQRGLHLPTSKNIYLPVLAELEKMDVIFKEVKK
jgi:saccharopine dehydrogenase (NADP+, L-glutamate forming)